MKKYDKERRKGDGLEILELLVGKTTIFLDFARLEMGI